MNPVRGLARDRVASPTDLGGATSNGMNLEKQKFIQQAIQGITEPMGIQCSTEIKEEIRGQSSVLAVSLQIKNQAHLLIGKDGQNLKALENIVRLMIWKAFPKEPSPMVLDINGYKYDKAAQAIELARSAVSRVRDTGRAEALVPMSSYERRVVHTELAAYTDIITESIGEEPQRRIVIKPFQVK